MLGLARESVATLEGAVRYLARTFPPEAYVDYERKRNMAKWGRYWYALPIEERRRRTNAKARNWRAAHRDQYCATRRARYAANRAAGMTAKQASSGRSSR